MFDSIEMGISKIVLFDGTPASVDYVLDLKRQAEVFTMLGCVYGSKRDTLMSLVKRIDNFLLNNNTARLPLQPKLLPIKGKYEHNPKERIAIILNELAEYLDDNPKLATATGLNGRLLPITVCLMMNDLNAKDYESDYFKFTSNSGNNTIHVKIPLFDRTVDLIVYFKDSKLKEYPLLDVLSRKSVDNITHERASGYELPKH